MTEQIARAIQDAIEQAEIDAIEIDVEVKP